MEQVRIRLEGISKSYYAKTAVTQALRKINLTFRMGEFVAITGESGSGKSTLLNIIGGMDTFDDGEMFVDGEATFQYDEADWEEYRRNKIGYVFQDYSLIGHYSVLDNMISGLLIMGKNKQEAEEEAGYYLKLVGLDGYETHRASELSSGQKQRLSIARALAKNTGIIVADEPTANLDEENTLRTMSILKTISKECLVILVTHEKRIARFFADRIIEIRDGEVYRDVENRAPDSYERMDDANIYLKEMGCATLESDFAKFRIYTEEKSEELFEDEKISLSIAFRDGKLYIKNHMHCDVIFEGEESGVKMLEEHRPKLDTEELQKFSYTLPKLKSKGKASLLLREILHMALENMKAMGKKQAYVLAILVVTAVLLTITMADFMNSALVDEASIVHTDSHYIMLDFAKVSSLYKDVEDYLGAKLTVATTSEDIEIVGISDTGESDIFCSQNLLLGFPTRGFRIANAEELRAAVPEEYENLVLAEDEILIREGRYHAYSINGESCSLTIGDDMKHVYQVVGTFPDYVGVDYILSEAGCKNVRNVVIYETKDCLFYTKDTKDAMAYFESIKEKYQNAFHLQIEIPHELELEEYKKAHQVDLDAKYLMAVICAVISLVMVYFTVKANAVSRSEELTVYRLIGISKQSILKAYVLEMFFLTCVTSLPAVLITSGVIKVIATIPSLEMGLHFPWWSVMALLVVLYIVHAVISILPVYGILSKPPATLALKE